MTVTTGCTVIFDGGSFTGALPANVEFKNGTAMTATASGSSIVFQSGYNMPAESTLAITGGSLSIADSTISGSITTSSTIISVSTSVTIATGGSMSFSSPSALSIPTMTINGTATISTNTTVASLTLGADSVVAFASGKFLSCSTTAAITGSQTLNGTGYFALPVNTTTSGFTQGTGADVRVCEYGAGVTALTAETQADLSVLATITKTTSSCTTLTEAYLNGAWVVQDLREDEGTFTTSPASQVRVFDGVQFTTASVTASVEGVTHYLRLTDSTWCSDAALTTTAAAPTSASVLYVYSTTAVTIPTVSAASKIYIEGSGLIDVGALTAEVIIGNTGQVKSSGSLTLKDFSGTPSQLWSKVTLVSPARFTLKDAQISE